MNIDTETLPAGDRWFVSIEMPRAIIEDFERLKTSAAGIRWTPPQQYHLTLRFIGETRPETVQALADRLSAIRVQSFVLELQAVGRFPTKGHARVLWAGVGSGHPRLFQLQQKVEEAVVASGIEPAVRRFHPHVTLARCARAAPGTVKEFLKTHRDYSAGPSGWTAFPSSSAGSQAKARSTGRSPLFHSWTNKQAFRRALGSSPSARWSDGPSPTSRCSGSSGYRRV